MVLISVTDQNCTIAVEAAVSDRRQKVGQASCLSDNCQWTGVTPVLLSAVGDLIYSAEENFKWCSSRELPTTARISISSRTHESDDSEFIEFN